MDGGSRINHPAGIYVAGDTYTNTMEGFFGHLEPSIKGTSGASRTSGCKATCTSSRGGATRGWSRSAWAIGSVRVSSRKLRHHRCQSSVSVLQIE